METVVSPPSNEVQVNTFLNTLASLDTKRGLKDLDVLNQLNSLKSAVHNPSDPQLQVHSLAVQEGLLQRIIALDPSNNPYINPQQADELRIYLAAARYLEMGKIDKNVDTYLKGVKLPKQPGAFSRRQFADFAVGAVTGLAGVALLPQAISALTTPSEQPANTPAATAEPATQTPASSKPTTPPKPTKTVVVKPTLAPISPATKPPEATATNPPIPKPPEPTKTTEINNLFTELIKPFIDEAFRRREQRIKEDPDYLHRVDSELNKDRINFFVLMYGETYEPPAAENVVIGSPTIISYNFKTQKVEMVSLTHDIRAPEVERHQMAKGEKIGPTKIDQAYWIGNFPLMQKTLENATGLSGDFQLAIPDSVIKDAIDKVYSDSGSAGLTVDVPFDLDTQEFIQDKQFYNKSHFSKGKQSMTGLRAMQFIKALPQNYDPKTERNIRKGLLIDALINKLQEKATDPSFLLRLHSFLQSEDRVKFDFNTATLLTENIGGLIKKMPSALLDKLKGRSLFPQREKTLYVVDTQSGDGGVQWVTSTVNPVHKKDLEKGTYPDKSFEVPGDGDPYAHDLVKDYWGSVRKLVKERLG